MCRLRLNLWQFFRQWAVGACRGPASSPVCLAPRPAAHERTRAHRARPDAHRRTRPAALRAALRGGHLVPCDARRRGAARHRPRRGLELPRLRPPAADLERQVARRAAAARPRTAGRSMPRRSTTAARIDAILCWSALPGGSRHHWGTDCDVIDAAALPAGLPRAAGARGVRAGRRVRAAHAVARREHGALRLLPSVRVDALRRRHRALAPELLAGRRRGARGAHPAGVAPRARRQRTRSARSRCSSACRRSTRASSWRWTRHAPAAARPAARPA